MCAYTATSSGKQVMQKRLHLAPEQGGAEHRSVVSFIFQPTLTSLTYASYYCVVTSSIRPCTGLYLRECHSCGGWRGGYAFKPPTRYTLESLTLS